MAKRVPEGPAPDPAVQKLRFQYAKRGRLRFTSTRDFQRAIERAVRRAGVPVAFSAGFHPHPKISYANAASTGTASEAEYFEIALREERDPEDVRAALDEALPPGLDVLRGVTAAPGALADRLEVSRWQIAFDGVEDAALAQAVQRFLAEEHLEVTRVMKKGPRTFDVRAAVLAATTSVGESGSPVLELVLRHDTPSVRPDDVLSGLRRLTGLGGPEHPLTVRLEQGPLLDGPAVGDPLAV